jgi:hypothetical protein
MVAHVPIIVFGFLSHTSLPSQILCRDLPAKLLDCWQPAGVPDMAVEDLFCKLLLECWTPMARQMFTRGHT